MENGKSWVNQIDKWRRFENNNYPEGDDGNNLLKYKN